MTINGKLWSVHRSTKSNTAYDAILRPKPLPVIFWNDSQTIGDGPDISLERNKEPMVGYAEWQRQVQSAQKVGWKIG
jgi:hypothetical protein